MSPSLNAEIIRPYSGVDEFAGALEGLQVQVRNQGTWTEATSVFLKPEDFEPLDVSFRWLLKDVEARDSLRSLLAEASLEANEVSLIGILRSTMTKHANLFLELPLVAILETGGVEGHPIPVNERPRLLRSHPIAVEFYLVLNQSIQGNFPFPYRRGTWLSQKHVVFRSEELLNFDFDWEPLTDEVRRDLKIHKNSLVYVENILAMHEADRFSDCVRAYLDEDYKSHLGLQNGLPFSKFLQTALVVDVIADSLSFTLGVLASNGVLTPWAEVESHPVFGNLIRSIASRGIWSGEAFEAEQFYGELARRPELVHESIADFFKLRLMAKAALSEGD